jgi:hypothetical protein
MHSTSFSRDVRMGSKPPYFSLSFGARAAGFDETTGVLSLA